ncbi:hypothetical protein NZK35_16650 [Stieleria sp. ICT_E10.1]|uniref:hypothetical protein n=1 Tax=Stieleria sedimenti TaxID=2976331 RepID=UPI00217F3458|nr:hypothetical protein [Stieleria sedimenti]MCS7468283.1 hypothetical protein [Stieleria sedimenti]
MPSWNHPKLGAFEFEDLGWFAEVRMPGFTQFDLDTPSDYDRAIIEFSFDAYEPNEFPNDDMVHVASNLFENHRRLITDGVSLLFDDIRGVGTDSGMWWHGDLEHVNEILENHARRLDELEGLFPLLNGPSVLIQEIGYGFDAACAIIGFESLIDVEHGIGWLTDGNKILGTGYRSDVSPNSSH